MYSESDISIVIPTYNRAEDLRKTLISSKEVIKNVKEVVIVDQSKNDETKNLIKKMKIANIRYVFSKVPSIARARNKGAGSLSKGTKIVAFIDDDVDVRIDYLKEILRIFNENPGAKAVGIYNGSESLSGFNKIENFAKKLFFLGYTENKTARITSPYGNTYPGKLNKVVNSQWLPGVNMAYKKEVFNDQKFDENLLGYTVAEDIDFSYRLYLKNKDGVYLSPFAKVIHRASTVERTPKRRMSYINQVDHFYFFFKNYNNTFLQRVKFIWSLFGITILRTIKLILSPKKTNYLKWKYYFESLSYCLSNMEKIRKGKVREFKIVD